MNNKGWGLGTMLGFLAILFLGLLYSFALINKNFVSGSINTSEAKEYYKTQENELAEVAKSYINNYYPNLENGNQLIVTLKTLKAYDYIDAINVYSSKDECSGYVIINKEKKNVTYEPYLNCVKYTTNDYLSTLDEK